MYAIIQDGGHQYRVEQGQRVRIHLREAEAGQTVTFEQVCLLAGDGGAPRIGNPFVAGAKVEAKILRPDVRAKKLFPSFYRQRKHTKRRIGHRQHYTEVEITGITA